MATIHRFFLEEPQFAEKVIILPKEISWQIGKVLRLKKGDTIGIFDKAGKEYRVVLEEITKDTVIGRTVMEFANTSEPQTKIVLYQALLPRDTFEQVLEKGTEIGIAGFVPLETKRSLVQVKDLREEKMDRWQKIVTEAAEQSERGKVPHVFPAMRFEDAIQKSVREGITILAWENEESIFLKDIKIASSEGSKKQIALFIGPEGGFTEEEVAVAKKEGATTVGLGPRILRSEIAGIFLATIALYQCGELDRKRNNPQLP